MQDQGLPHCVDGSGIGRGHLRPSVPFLPSGASSWLTAFWVPSGAGPHPGPRMLWVRAQFLLRKPWGGWLFLSHPFRGGGRAGHAGLESLSCLWLAVTSEPSGASVSHLLNGGVPDCSGNTQRVPLLSSVTAGAVGADAMSSPASVCPSPGTSSTPGQQAL